MGDVVSKRHRLLVNGEQVEVTCPIGTTLAEVIRGNLGLAGTRVGCWEGACGACTVLVHGLPVASCCRLVHDVDESEEVWTVEGAANNSSIAEVAAAFNEIRAFQCGYCTNGFVMAVAALLHSQETPSLTGLMECLAGNVCRCGAYTKIVEAAVLSMGLNDDGAECREGVH